jgi:hypothetical protein
MSKQFLHHTRNVKARLAVHDVTDGAIVLEVNVETLGLEVLSDHHSRLDDTALLREILLAETL